MVLIAKIYILIFLQENHIFLFMGILDVSNYP